MAKYYALMSVLIVGLRCSTAFCAPQMTSIKVFLLDSTSPCTLKGPFQASQLKEIHAVGPAQVFPDLKLENLSKMGKTLEGALTKIKGTALPHELDNYRRRVEGRLMAQLELLRALDKIERSKNVSLISDPIQKWAKGDLKPLEEAFRSAWITPPQGSMHWDRGKLTQAMDTYNEAIEADPEVEFHRILKRLQVEYLCNFGESD